MSLPPISTLLALLSVVVSGCLAADYGWQPHKEFTFAVQGQDVVGLPQLKLQYAGFRYQGELRVQTHSSRVLLLKLSNMNYAKIHEELTQGWWKGSEAPLKNKIKALPITTSTIVVKMTRSMSPELIVHSDLADWQLNFIKGVVSHLLVYLNDNSPSSYYSNRLTNSPLRDVYSVTEDSVSGRCEVIYEINPLPRQFAPYNRQLCEQKQLWEITKTRNFSNCQVLNEDHDHLPTSDCTPGGANCGRFWTRASLTQMIGCGEMNSVVLLSSVSSSTKNAQLQLKNNSQAVVNSNLNITLVSTLDLKTKFNMPQNKQTMKTLLYVYSTTPKDFGSRSCQENTSSDEDEGSKNNFDSTRQINPTNENNNNEHSKTKKGKLGFRNKRGIEYKYSKQYRKKSNEPDNEDNLSNEQPTLKKNPMRFNDGNNEKRTNTLWVNTDEESNSQQSKETNHFLSEERKNKNSRKTKNNQRSEESKQSSEEWSSQPSEEMDLEEQWKISGKENKRNPPPQPFNLFAIAHRTFYDLSCLNPKFRQIIGDIASDLEEINTFPEKNSMDKLSMAVDICRSLPLDQLSAVAEEVFEVHNGAANNMKSNERKVFRDVIAMCGTHPALQLFRGWIERKQIEGDEAAQMIASIPSHIFSPTKYLVQDFLEMVQNIAEKDDQQLTTAAVLSLSNLVRGACVNKASRKHRFSSIIKPVCDESLVARYTEWLAHKISSDMPLRRAYIEALGNVGSRQAIDILKNIAINPKYSSYLRTSAIFGMRYQVLRKNSHEIAPLLMSLYHNYSLPVSARIASSALLLYSDPGLALWQRLAISTWYEPSSAVSQFVSSSLRNMANCKDSLYGYMTKAAALVQPLARPSKVSIKQPFNMLTSWLSRDLEKLVLEQISWMQFNDYSNFYYRHSLRSSGFSRTNVEASFSTSNPDELWSALKEVIISTNIHSARSPRRFGQTLAQIRESLDLQHRSMPQLQAELHLKINNMMERMILINKDTFKSLVTGGHKLISDVMRNGKLLSYQKADMDSFHISTTTELGFPVEFSVRTPWIVRAKAELNGTDEGLIFGAAFMYSAQMQSSVSLMSPWDNVAHMAGAYATNFVQLPPYRLTSNIDSTDKSIIIKSTYIDQHRLLYFNMQPFTSQHKIKVHQAVLLSPDTIPIKLGESVQVPISWMSRYLNTVYSSEQTEHFNALDFLRNAGSVLGFPTIMPNMEPRSFETVMTPLHPITMNFSMSMATKSMGLLELESPSYTIIGKMFNALSHVSKSEQSTFMSQFRLFGGSEETSTTGDSTSTKTDNSNKKNIEGDTTSDNSVKRDNSNSSEKDSEGANKQPTTPSSTSQSNSNDQNKTEESKSTRNQSSSQGDEIMDSSAGSQVYATTYDSAVGSFNASQVDPFTNLVNGSGVSYLIDQVLSKINSGKAVVFAFDMQSAQPGKPVKLSAYAAYASTYSKRASRFGLFVKNDQSQTKMTSVHEDPIDISTNLKRRASEDLQHNIFVDFIRSANGQNLKLFMKGRLGASRSELAALRSSPLLDICSQGESAIDLKCQQLREQIKQISFGNITLYYNDDAKYFEKMAVKYMNAAKVMIPRSEEKAGEGFNTMTMMFDVDQRTRSIDTYITTPSTSLNIRKLPMTQLPMPTVVEWATQPSTALDYCGISAQRFRTFDRGEYPYKMKPHWHLVTQDCTRKYGISVLAQPSGNNTLKIEVNKNDKSVIRVEEGPKVYLDDKLQLLDSSHPLLVVRNKEGHILVHTVYTPDDSVHIQLPHDHLDLVYTGPSLIMQAGPWLQGRLCGLCGSYTNTGVEQYLTARGHFAKSPAEFAASYELKSAHADTDS